MALHNSGGSGMKSQLEGSIHYCRGAARSATNVYQGKEPSRLKILDLGAACHSTSTKVRDEGPFAIYYIVIYSVKT